MVISWAILQVADIIFPLLGIEDSILRVVLLVLIIGFPVWVVFAYFFEWTAEGFKLTSQVAEEKSISKSTSRKLNHYIIGGLVIAVIFLVVDRITNFSGTLPSREMERSIAVLPFDNLGDPETSYFAEGMAEDILTQLSKVADLRVLSRVTLKGYDATGKTVEEIGADLGVNFLLTGSVRKANEQIRVTCQLIQVNPEEQTWAENFDRQLNDIFRIQSEVATNIAGQLQTNLTIEEERRINLEPTQNLRAYTLYLKGREAYGRYTSEGIKDAISLFKESIEEDPSLALAYAGLADAYAQLAFLNILPKTYYDSALLLGKRSVEINPELAEGWKSLGLVYHYTGELVKSQKHYEKSLEINPNYYPAVTNLVGNYGMQGYFDKAMLTAAKSLKLNPLASHSYSNVADGLKYMGLYDSALTLVRMGLDIDPKPNSYGVEADILLEMGDVDGMKESMDTMIALDSNANYIISAASRSLRVDSALALAYLQRIPQLSKMHRNDYFDACSILGHLLTDADSAQTWLRAGIDYFEAARESGYATTGDMQELLYLYTLNGNIEEALEVLQAKIDNGFIYTARLKNDPRMTNLWGNPAFDRLINEVDQRRADFRLRLTANASAYSDN